MDILPKNLLSELTSKGAPLDVGGLIKGELEEAISPVSGRVESLESKIQILIAAVERVEKLLVALQPLTRLIDKIPFLK